MLAALSLIVASACVANNIFDRKIDAHMDRTKKRALVVGSISLPLATSYSALLLVLGMSVFLAFGSAVSLCSALLGWLTYVLIYTPAKKRTVYATLIGSVPGATPPVIGYSWISGNLDWACLILFLILFFWQIPHFYSIAIYRLKDYRDASVPVLPLKKGLIFTKINILSFVLCFFLASLGLRLKGYTSNFYLIFVLVLSFWWAWVAAAGFKTNDNTKWARGMFVVSLIVITSFSLLITFDYWLGRL